MSEGNVLKFAENLDNAGTSPRALPEGHYIAQVMGGEQSPMQDTLEVKGEEKRVAKVTLEILSTGEGDVSVETEDGEMNVKGLRLYETFFLDKLSLWKLNQLAQAAGCDTSSDEFDLDDLVGKQVEVVTKNRPNKNDPDQVFSNAKKFLPVS